MNASASELESITALLMEKCAPYETTYFLKFLGSLLLALPKRKEHPGLKKLLSPLRQIFYAGSLNLQSRVPGTRNDVSKEAWDEIADLLQAVEVEYSKNIGFYQTEGEPLDYEKIKVVLPTFLSYFCSGPLSYQEQEMERITRTFVNFEKAIYNSLGVYPKDFVAYYEHLDSLMNEKLNKAIYYAHPDRWKAFTDACLAKGLNDPKDWVAEAPEEIHAYAQLIQDPGYLIVVKTDEIDDAKFPRAKFRIISDLLSSKRSPADGLIFYTQENPLLEKPVFKIEEDTYLLFFQKHILDAAYKLLFSFCRKEPGQVTKHRDTLLEAKTAEIFEKFFKKGAFIYKGYYVDGKAEQDILILYRGLALIIECKATNFREPLRDPLKAYTRLKTDFDSNIQYGYDQTYRVKSRFIAGQPFNLTDKNGNMLYTVNPKRYPDVFSVVVTLSRFGMIETDLGAMLSIKDDDQYPWAVNIDDLEAILLVLAKEKKHCAGRLKDYLTHRENYHNHLICDDELELFGLFLTNREQYEKMSTAEDYVVLEPGYTAPVEKAYREGMGFENERYYAEKISKKIGFMYDS